MNIRKTFLGLLLGLFGLEVLSSIVIHLFYFSSLPKSPDAQTGQIYQMVVSHGSIRYGSAQELHIFQTIDALLPVAGLLFLLAVMLGLSWGIFKIAPGRKLNE